MSRLDEIEKNTHPRNFWDDQTNDNFMWLIKRIRTLEEALNDAVDVIHHEFCGGSCHPIHKRFIKALGESGDE